MDPALTLLQDLTVTLLLAATAGFVARRLGLSPIVGYLVAGVVIGDPRIHFASVADPGRVASLAQIGLVLILFGIGLSLRLGRLRELGPSLILACALGAYLVYQAVDLGLRVTGHAPPAGLFWASLVLCSSSAVIGRVLLETRQAHERHGQLALGLTLLEDVVAIVLITILGAYASSGSDGGGNGAVLGQVGLLGSFVLLLLTAGLVLVPRWLKRYHQGDGSEQATLLVGGLLFGLSLLAAKAGYSLALGAFLLGAIVAETNYRTQVERAFEGFKELFGAVFFTSIGMSISLASLPAALGPILALTLVCLLGRPLAATLALLAVGHPPAVALRTAFCVTPIGEFSFILAGLGIASGFLPEPARAAAVGTCLATSLAAPVLIRHSETLTAWLLRLPLPRFSRAHEVYRELLDTFAQRSATHPLWRLLRLRLVQVGVEFALVSGILLFARPVMPHILPVLGLQPERLVVACYWLGVLLLAALPFVALWRNLEAMRMILADYLGQSLPEGPARRVEPLTRLLRLTLLGGLLLFWGSLLPTPSERPWMILGVLIPAGLLVGFGWRRFVRWQSEVQFSLESAFAKPAEPQAKLPKGWRRSGLAEDLRLEELHLPSGSRWAGASLSDIGLRQHSGASLAVLERGGVTIEAIGPQTRIYPGDRLLLLGSSEQNEVARQRLTEVAQAPTSTSGPLDSCVLEPLELAAGHPACGRSLAELNWGARYGVQVAGVVRAERRLTGLGPDFRLEAGDRVLLLGAPARLRELRACAAPTIPLGSPA